MCRLPARALMGSNRRGADEQVASRGPMGSDGRSTNEVLLTGAPGRRAIGKQLGAKEATASKERTCWQGNTLLARVAPAGKETHCRQRRIVALCCQARRRNGIYRAVSKRALSWSVWASMVMLSPFWRLMVANGSMSGISLPNASEITFINFA